MLLHIWNHNRVERIRPPMACVAVCCTGLQHVVLRRDMLHPVPCRMLLHTWARSQHGAHEPAYSVLHRGLRDGAAHAIAHSERRSSTGPLNRSCVQRQCPTRA
jgi:hypothetical protein